MSLVLRTVAGMRSVLSQCWLLPPGSWGAMHQFQSSRFEMAGTRVQPSPCMWQVSVNMSSLLSPTFWNHLRNQVRSYVRKHREFLGVVAVSESRLLEGHCGFVSTEIKESSSFSLSLSLSAPPIEHDSMPTVLAASAAMLGGT